MKRSLLLLIAVVSVLAMVGSAFAQTAPFGNMTGPQPTVAGQIGTSQVQRGLDVNGNQLLTKRVGVIAYCADIAPNADDAGIFGRQEFQEGVDNMTNLWFNASFLCPQCLKNPILDATTIGYFGAQNIVDMIMYDDGIPRFSDVVLVDGDKELPTGAALAQNFDAIIVYTDNKCGVPIPVNIANSAAKALTDFLALGTAAAPKGAVVTGFAFNTSIGLGNGAFGGGLVPFRKTSPAVDTRCSPTDPLGEGRGPCTIGFCPAPSVRMFSPTGSAPACFSCPALTCDPAVDPNCCDPNDPNVNIGCTVPSLACSSVPDPLHTGFNTCLDSTSAFCGQPVNPVNDPTNIQPDRVCQSLWKGVNGPTSASFASTGVTLNTNAVLCGNYLGYADLPLVAVNQARNVVTLNLFPAYSEDLRKTWFSCILANAAIYASGERRCRAALPGEGGEFCDAAGANCSICN